MTISLSAVAQQRWWGNYSAESAQTYMGMNVADTYTCGIQLSKGRAVLNGASIHGVRFYLRDKTNISDVKVWLSTNRPASADAANVKVVDVPQAQLVDIVNDNKMMEVTLPEAVAMPDGLLYVGYAFKVGAASKDADKNPVVCVSNEGGSGAFWIRTAKSLPSWNDLTTRHGALAMQLLISNPTLPAQAVSVSDFTRQVALSGQTAQAQVSIASEGLQEVKSVDYVTTVNGQSQTEQHYDLPASLWATGSYAVLPVTLNVPAATGIYDCSVQITKVNGAANTSATATATSPLISVSQTGHRRTVVEEFTGTWCTNCPRGIVGMANMAKQFGDDFIGIAVHANNGKILDPMYLGAYSPLIPASVPGCTMDRALTCDPYLGIDRSDYHYHADKAFQLMQSQPTEADITLQAAWENDEKTSLKLTAQTTFYMNSDRADYALAFVMTEDGMKGTTKEWWQVNGESGKNTFPDDDMAIFRNGTDPVTDIAYDHVPVAAVEVVNGVAGSIQQPLVAGAQQAYSTTLDLSANVVIQDKSQLTANVLLLSTATGQIVNAAKVKVGGADTGVQTIETLVQAKGKWYTLDGRCVESPTTKGIYIYNGKKITIK